MACYQADRPVRLLRAPGPAHPSGAHCCRAWHGRRVGRPAFTLRRTTQARAFGCSLAAIRWQLLFQANTGGYFDPGSDRLPLLHLWLLAVEEQFYLVWPIGLILLLRLRPKLLAPAIALLAVASLVLAEVLLVNNPGAAFYRCPPVFGSLPLAA